jgi:phage terminase large subunit
MENINIKIKKSIFNPVYLPYLENEDRYLVFYGGGSSGKSYFIGQRYIYKILNPKKRTNLLVVRQTGKSNRDSTFALLVQIIREWNLSQYFSINKSNLRIKCLISNNEIIFAGLDDVEKIKSTTFENGELTDIWRRRSNRNARRRYKSA